MDEDGGLGIRHWGCFEPPSKGNLGLRLLSSSVAERHAKPLLPNSGFIHRQCSVPEQPAPLEFVRDGWLHHGRDNGRNVFGGAGWVRHGNDSSGKNSLIFPTSSCGILSDPSPMPNVQMLQHLEPQPRDNKVLMMEETNDRNEAPLKKRPRGRPQKSPKPKKPKKVSAPKDEAASGSQGKACRKSAGMVINGIDFDISTIPTPVCSCTGKQQQCYRWGIGGWQSACCTTTISMYPLPMSTKKRGARIAGRKMSQGAFKKVLEKLAGEGYNLCNPIDLRTFWAKHGTNKFVTIR